MVPHPEMAKRHRQQNRQTSGAGQLGRGIAQRHVAALTGATVLDLDNTIHETTPDDHDRWNPDQFGVVELDAWGDTDSIIDQHPQSSGLTFRSQQLGSRELWVACLSGRNDVNVGWSDLVWPDQALVVAVQLGDRGHCAAIRRCHTTPS